MAPELKRRAWGLQCGRGARGLRFNLCLHILRLPLQGKHTLLASSESFGNSGFLLVGAEEMADADYGTHVLYLVPGTAPGVYRLYLVS